jgi:RNA polymerase sigma-70 factor (ECF subfamily)
LTPATAQALEARIAKLIEARDWEGASTVALRGYGPMILTYLRSVLRDDDLASDVFSVFSEKLWRSIADYRGESSFATWAYRIAWFSTLEHQRAERRRREDRLSTSEVSKIVQEVRESTLSGMQTETKDRWAKIKESLDPVERSLLLLRVERELSWKEVARIMSDDGTPMAQSALRKRFERLRVRLHKLAKEHGVRDTPRGKTTE